MLYLAHDMRELPEEGLSDVYDLGGNPGALSSLLVYLRESFFGNKGAVYCFWKEDNCFLCALRLEPYRDGYLLEALQTAQGHRRKGCAFRLLTAVQKELQSWDAPRVYAHVSKNNKASLALHRKAGFRLQADSAALIDGTVTTRFCTLVWEPEKSDISG